ncbi:hypothetical protein [Paenibacillus sp. UNC217MF]|uniref:hypothetical protein n=1 Tax=Paenibacillus sp. UNC217MF TaxID=1449062 RepID=UPI000491BDB1|nr:hypothetical protein [Paenibacillus sp. UNC217MF]
MIKELYQDYQAKMMIERALHQLFMDYCHENVEKIEVKTRLVQSSSIMPGGVDHKWHAITSSSKVPEMWGHHGKDVISIFDFPCSKKYFVLDREEEKFIPKENLILDGTDNAGFHPLHLLFYFTVYCVYFLTLFLYVLIVYMKKWNTRKRLNKKDK